MFRCLNIFKSDESGSVTVDWVVLTAGIVAVNIFLIIGMIEDGLEQNGTYIDGVIDEASQDL